MKKNDWKECSAASAPCWVACTASSRATVDELALDLQAPRRGPQRTGNIGHKALPPHKYLYKHSEAEILDIIKIFIDINNIYCSEEEVAPASTFGLAQHAFETFELEANMKNVYM